MVRLSWQCIIICGCLLLLFTTTLANENDQQLDVLVLICTQSFTGEELVEDHLLDRLLEQNWNVQVSLVDEMEDIDWSPQAWRQDPDKDPWTILSQRARVVLLVASTFADGDPPHHATEFAHGLASRSKTTNTIGLSLFQYAVFGLGDSSYVHYCAFAKFADQALEQMGNHRLLELHTGDALTDQTAAFSAWVDRVLEQLTVNLPIRLSSKSTEPNKTPNTPHNLAAYTGFDWRRSAFPPDRQVATLLNVQELLPPSASTRVVHVSLQLPPNATALQPGDQVGVFPQNSGALVQRALDWLGLTHHTPTKLMQRNPNSKEWVTVVATAEELLTHHVDLAGRATTSALRALLPFVGTLSLRDLARQWTTQQDDNKLLQNQTISLEQWVAGRPHVTTKLDVAILFECRPSLQAFARAMGPMQPRLYSVATVTRQEEREGPVVGLCISIAQGGLCSNYVSQLTPGSNVTVFLRKSQFHFSANSSSPALFVGAGSGIGVFLGFLNQSLSTVATRTTPSLDGRVSSVQSNQRLVMGSRSPLEILYQQQLQEFEAMGRVTVHYAFSRVFGQPKMHAQDLLLTSEMREMVWDNVFQDNSHVYVCGRLELCSGTKVALVKIAMIHGGMDQRRADEVVEKMENRGRFLTDCWSVEDPPASSISGLEPDQEDDLWLAQMFQNESFPTNKMDLSHIPKWPSYLRLLASGELERRVELATNMYSSCASCGRFCEVNRLSSDPNDWGECRVGDNAIVSAVDAHFGEENCLTGVNGSGTIFFGACNLKCVYCQNWKISKEDRGNVVNAEQLAGFMLQLQERGCHNINFVSPTPNVLAILRGVLIAAKMGLRLPIVFNSGGYDSVASLRLFEDVVDIYMPDAKYASRTVARKLSKIDNYAEINQAAIKEMHRQVGDLQIDPRTGLAWRGLLVRHLVLPSDYGGTEDVAAFLYNEISENTFIHVMDYYRPEHEARYDTKFGLNRKPSIGELFDAHKKAKYANLYRIFPEADSMGGEEKNENGRTRAHVLAAEGKTVALLLFLEENLEFMIDAQDANGWTPLHEATRRGHIEAVKGLVERGADIQMLTKSGDSALTIAKATHGDNSGIYNFLLGISENDKMV